MNFVKWRKNGEVEITLNVKVIICLTHHVDIYADNYYLINASLIYSLHMRLISFKNFMQICDHVVQHEVACKQQFCVAYCQLSFMI